MRVVHTIADLRQCLAGRERLTFVPTMGNLHEGHLSLVRTAAARGGTVVASIFVNRLQFGRGEDFDRYPRTLERDSELLAAGNCDVLFAPDEAELYPTPQQCFVRPPEAIADVLEGKIRPGFFTGVCTVVLKLFNIVQPTAAVFGKKDYQQLLVIRHMVRQLAMPVEIIAGETIRSSSGLALSSRNGYLSTPELAEAAHLHEALASAVASLRAGSVDYESLERQATDTLAARGWIPDYVAIRRQEDLREPGGGGRLVVLGAARLGGTRLIDNIEV